MSAGGSLKTTYPSGSPGKYLFDDGAEKRRRRKKKEKEEEVRKGRRTFKISSRMSVGSVLSDGSLLSKILFSEEKNMT